jgi:lysozyme
MKASQHCIDMIKHFEGLKLEAYQCVGDVWSVGYGHTKGVIEGDKITQDQADQWLLSDLHMVETHMQRMIKVTLNQHQWDALVSWCFNLGCGSLRRSTMLLVINANDLEGVTKELIRWNKANGKVSKGLERRRKAEAHLFDTGAIDYFETKAKPKKKQDE